NSKSESSGGQIVVVALSSQDDAEFQRAMNEYRDRYQWSLTVLHGEPSEVRKQLAELAGAGQQIQGIGVTEAAGKWLLWERLAPDFPQWGLHDVVRPKPYSWPNFLMSDNILNIANQIAVIAIV